jgi:hypothetical protein
VGEGLGGNVGRDDFTGTGMAGGEQDEHADRAHAGDDDAIARAECGAGERVQGDGERFGEDGDRWIEPVRQFDELSGLDRDFGAERALDMRAAHRAAEEAHVEAMVAHAISAEAADAAGQRGVDRHRIAHREVRDAGAEASNGADDFVAEHHGFGEPDRAEAAVADIVQVRAADAATIDPNTRLTGAGRRSGARLDAEIAGAMDHDCGHGKFLLETPGGFVLRGLC